MDNDLKPRLMTLKQSSSYTGIPLPTLKLYVNRGDIMSYKIGKRRYVSRLDIDVWLEDHRAERKVIMLRRQP